MSNIEATQLEKQKMEDKYLKIDLIHFFLVLVVLAVVIAALAVWNAQAHFLEPFTTQLLSFFKIQL